MTTSILDAHVHLWDADRHPLSWWRPALGLPRRAALGELRHVTVAAPAPIAGAIAVQAADTVQEAEWLTSSAALGSFIRAVVLQYDARADAAAWAGMAQSVIDRIDAGDLRARVAGIRLATPAGALDLADVPRLDDLAAGLSASNRVLELLLRAEQLPAAAALAARHPGLRIVLCHLGIGGDDPGDDWRSALAAFAEQPATAAKVSGLVRSGPAETERLRAAVGHAVDVFGAGRVMFGSDWPVSARFAGYREIVERTDAALPRLTDAERREFWADTAARVYELPSRG
ncbi:MULTISPECIES: amidohydrolase family protein [unclassified Microbacterium]|uniref:amidohydrolase family protein n=1 Tax=unclassified Microbacterium TaxID=2609290 RepID=UPI00300FC3F1